MRKGSDTPSTDSLHPVYTARRTPEPAEVRLPIFCRFRFRLHMEFFNEAVTVLQTLVVALGAGLGIWGAVNLLEGYGNDNPGANAHVS